MSMCKAYAPAQGYKYQILTKSSNERSYEHCDYAKDKEDKNYLLNEYKLAYGNSFNFKTILLPAKYWNN